jgi:hypothetical protein
MKKLIIFSILIIGFMGHAQIQDAWVFFADKENVATSIANPITILTQDAIDRKNLQGVTIDERDVPVNENYIQQIKAQTGITVYAKSKWMNCVYVRGTQNDIANLLTIPFVTSIEYADKSLNFLPPGDTQPPSDKFQIETSRVVYNYGSAANQIQMLHGNFLHEQDFTGQDMKIAVLDAGFPGFTSNPGFANVVNENRLLGTYNFIDRNTNVEQYSTHGTKTTSDIGGFLQDQFVGTAPQASFYLFITEDGSQENPVEEAWWVEALERADSLGVHVVNTSLGYQDFDNPNYDHTYQDLDGQTTFSARGGNIAFDKGMLLVTSAGNDGGGFTFVGTPGDSQGVFTIGAVDEFGNYANFSSIGPTVDGRVKPDVMAQGAPAAVINTSGFVDFNNGTSFSSPILAGAIACLWQSRLETPNGQIMQLVRESANLYNNPTPQMGYGIPNFEVAFNALQQLGIEDQLLKLNFALYPNPVNDKLFISFPENQNEAKLTLYSILGAKILEKNISLQDNSINMASLKKGVYLVSITANSKTTSFKVVKN